MHSHHHDVEMGAGAHTIQHPSSVYNHETAFPPRYNEAVNDEMRRFPELEGQTGKFETIEIEEPNHHRQKGRPRRSWKYWVAWIVALMLIAILLGTGLALGLSGNKQAVDKADQGSVSAPDSGNTTTTIVVPAIPSPPPSLELRTKTVTQTSIRTRDSSETTVTVFATLEPSTSTENLVATVLSVVTVTGYPPTSTTPETSTVTAVVTQTPQTTPTVTVTSTFTPSQASTSTSSTMNAAESSIAAELSRISAKLTPSAIPSVSSWLSTSATTATVTQNFETPVEVAPSTSTTVIPTHSGYAGRCGVLGMPC